MSKMLSKAEKEKRVIELHEQGMPFRDIARVVRKSFGDISSILKKQTAEEEENKKRHEEKLGLSKGTQAFKLFEEGNTPIDVAIKLDLREEEVTKLYRDYWKIKGLYNLNQLYEEINDEIFPVVKLYIHTKNAGMGPQHVVNALKIVERLPSIENQFQTLRNDVYMLESQKENVKNDLQEGNNQIAAVRATLHSYNVSINIKYEELANLNCNKHQLENFIVSLKKNNHQYLSFRSVVVEQIRQMLSDKKVMLIIAVSSVLEVLKEDPNKQLLIYDYLDDPPHTIPTIPPGLDRQQYKQFCQTILLELAEVVFENLLNKCVDSTISSAVARSAPQESLFTNNYKTRKLLEKNSKLLV